MQCSYGRDFGPEEMIILARKNACGSDGLRFHCAPYNISVCASLHMQQIENYEMDFR